MSNRKAASAESRSRKRQRREEKLQQYGVDLPDIPGVPVQVVPLQVYALKANARLFRRLETSCRVCTANASADSASASEAVAATEDVTHDAALKMFHGNVMDGILQRVQAAGSSTEQQSLQAQDDKLQRVADEATDAWLEAVHRHVRDFRRPQHGQDNTAVAPSSPPPHVAVAALEHLWSMLMPAGTTATTATPPTPLPHQQRAALYLSGQLLLRSADARARLFGEDNANELARWLDALLSTMSRCRSTDVAHGQRMLEEARALLKTLESRFGSHYPTMGVARLQLEQSAPPSTFHHNNGDDAVGSAADWRSIRALAMNHVEQETQRVNKLLERAQACLETLVPRFTLEVTNDDDDEVDIDWEDGWEDNGEGGTDDLLSDGDTHHDMSVERTLAAMQQSGAVREGRLHIDMGAAASSNETTASIPEVNLLARTRLSKCVDILSLRHLPRLTTWVQALTNGDNMMFQNGALVRMPAHVEQRAQHTLELLLRLKTDIASVLRSARQLGIEPTTADGANASAERPRPRQPTPQARVLPRNEQLAANLARRRTNIRDVTRQRSNRIQIKLRKT